MVTSYDKNKERILYALKDAEGLSASLEEYADFLEEVSGEVEARLDAAREDLLRKEKQVEHPGRL